MQAVCYCGVQASKFWPVWQARVTGGLDKRREQSTRREQVEVFGFELGFRSGLLVGAFIGTNLGIFVIALCRAARE